MNPPIPENEAARLAALYEYQILDTDPEPAFDDLANLAAYICSTPMASISLVDADRQWFKAKVGLEITETPRQIAFCAHTILEPEVLIVPDAKLDSRFANNPLVTSDPGMRFYAGIPLTTSNGYAIGAVCVMDRQPRQMTTQQVEALKALGRQAIAQLDLRQHNALLAKSAAERQQTQAALRKAKDELELRVAERTAELVSVNEQLSVELLERKHVEEALRVSQARFAGILEIADDAIISVDANQRIILFNQGAEKIFGYSAAEILNQPLGKLLPQQFEEIHRQHVDKFSKYAGKARKMGERREIYGRRSDGSEFPAEASISKLEVGGETIFTTILRDISDRKRNQAALERLSHQNELILNSVGEGLCGLDLQGKITFVNPAAAKLLGYKIEELIGQSINTILQQDVETGRRGDGETGRRGDAESDPDQDLCTWSESGEFIRGEEEEEAGRRGGGDGGSSLTTLDPLPCLPFDPSSSKLESPGSYDGVSPRHPVPALPCPIQESLRDGTVHQVRKAIFWRRDGCNFPVEYVSTPILRSPTAVAFSGSKSPTQTEILGAVIAFRDITERQIVERMKDEFISVVSHELRTPLTSIHGSLGILASGLLSTQPEKSQRLLEIAVDSTERLVRLINDILDVERIESGKVTMAKLSGNAADLMAQAADTMQAMADKAGVTLSVSTVSAQLWADPDRIIQTLTNLLSNGIKFSSRGDTVWLSAELSPSSQSPTILFKVQDRGRGIPADKLETIFERFQQVDVSDSRNSEGTGLGLAICRSIVQQHGGRIWVESTLGEGSTFYFTLPLEGEKQ
jgi:PAS domain S-box-containing protein